MNGTSFPDGDNFEVIGPIHRRMSDVDIRVEGPIRTALQLTDSIPQLAESAYITAARECSPQAVSLQMQRNSNPA